METIIKQQKTFNNNFITEVMDKEGLNKLLYKGGSLKKQYKNVFEEIRYFDFNDISISYFPNERYEKSLRFVVAYDKNNIYGVLKFAEYGDGNAISFASVNKNFKNLGICTILLDVFTTWYKGEYGDEILKTSQYSVSGWKYAREKMLKYCVEKGINFKDNVVGYPDECGNNQEFYDLMNESRKIINKKTIILYV